MRLLALLDTLSQLDADSVADIAGPTWHKMRGMRNRLVHGYTSVSRRILIQTVENELTPLETALERRLASLTKTDRH